MKVNEITIDSYGWYFRNIFESNEKIVKSIAKDIHKRLARLKGMVEHALQPFMKAIKLKRSLSSYKEVSRGLGTALAPAFTFFKQIPISEMASKESGGAEANGSEEVKYIVVMTRAGWPPLFDVPIEFIRLINSRYRDLGRDAFRAFAAKAITDLYDKKGVNAILARWSQKKKLEQGFPFLRAALAAHNGGKYDLSVPVLVAKLDLLLARIASRAGGLEARQFTSYVDSLLSGKNEHLPLKGMIIDAMCENIAWRDRTVSALSRYALLHGAGANNGVREISLKLILILDMLVRLL